MPLSPEQEALCDHLEKGMPSAAALIRQQAREIDDLWDRLSHAYALVFWSFTVTGQLTRSGKVATLDEGKAQFQKSWDAWKAWAKLEEADYRSLAPNEVWQQSSAGTPSADAIFESAR